MKLQAAFALLLLGCLSAPIAAVGCKEDPRYGPPSNGVNGPSSPSFAGSLSDDGVCSCIVASRIDPEGADSCTYCLNKTGFSESQCKTLLDQCLADPSCSDATQDCLLDCAVPKGSTPDLGCVAACVLPFADTAPLFELFKCACNKCQGPCGLEPVVTCNDLGAAGTGGGGGAGGGP